MVGLCSGELQGAWVALRLLGLLVLSVIRSVADDDLVGRVDIRARMEDALSHGLPPHTRWPKADNPRTHHFGVVARLFDVNDKVLARLSRNMFSKRSLLDNLFPYLLISVHVPSVFKDNCKHLTTTDCVSVWHADPRYNVQ